MLNLVILFVHFIATLARLLGPGGIRSTLVLFEAWQGRNPFVRENPLGTLHAITNDRLPALTYLAGTSDWSLHRILQKALEKDPDERYHTMRDLGIDLRRLKHDTESAKLAPTATAVPARARRLPLLYALVGLVLAGGGWLLFRSRTPADFAPLRLTFTQLTDQPGPGNFPSLSSDGKSFVYASRASGNWDIYLQRVGGKNPINLTEDSLADDTQPVFSRDGEWIAFRSSRESRNPGSFTGGGIFVMGATGESVKADRLSVTLEQSDLLHV